VVLAAGSVAVGLAALAIRRRRRRSAAGEAARLRSLYWRMRRELSPGWLAGEPSLTPAEYLLARGAAMEPRAPLEEAMQELTRLYVQAAYSPAPPPPAELARAGRAWRAAWWNRFRVRMNQFVGKSEGQENPT
jgi:hypothetical protein